MIHTNTIVKGVGIGDSDGVGGDGSYCFNSRTHNGLHKFHRTFLQRSSFVH